MTQEQVIAVAFAADLPPAERESLLAALRSAGRVQDAQPKDLGWQMVLVVLQQTAEVADHVTKIAGLATLLYGWAQALRGAGQTPRATIKRPDRPALDLATASEQELLAYLLDRPPA